MATVTCALGPDAAGTLLTGRLSRAAARLDVAVYELSPDYAWLLSRAHRRGTRVRALLDRHPGANTGGAAALVGAGVPCRELGGRWGKEAHWKLLAGDDWMAVGTGNLIRRDAPRDPRGQVPPEPVEAGPGTREWWVFVDGAPVLVEHARAALNGGWREAAPWRPVARLEGPQVPPVGVPRPLIPPATLSVAVRELTLLVGGRRVAEALLPLLRGARRRGLVLVPYVHPEAPAVNALLTLMRQLAARGADVRLMLGQRPAVGAALDTVALGVPLAVMDPRRCTTGHAKGVVADDVAVVGSANWSGGGLGGNREAAMVLRSAAAADYFAAAFEHDWATAQRLL